MKYKMQIIISLLAIIGIVAMSPVSVLAVNPIDNIKTGSENADPNKDANKNRNLAGFVSSMVSLITNLVGIASVVMIILGGFKYVTSGGDSGKIGEAKKMIAGAVIGLIIVIFSYAIVTFVQGGFKL